ncbi:MAG: hypothetical protein KF729_32885 [Sandaracinaceae bacterium]|nr:hypothetical protein [Sandaracinaceae bacterium]
MNVAAAEGALREALDALADAGAALRARPRAEIAEALAEAWEELADAERARGSEARERLVRSSGLTLPMVAWALRATLGDARAELAALAARMEPPPGTREAPPALGALFLAGNVFTAAVAPLSVALLARVPVLVKASSADDALPRLFADALAAHDAALGAACLVVSPPRGAVALEATILHRAGVVSVFGRDETLASIRARLPAGTAFVGHGHGLGLGWVARGADLRAAAKGLARDVAAYDQRGCMSPHAIGVDGDGAAFAEALAEALADEARVLPRGPLPTAVGAAQVQWRGVAIARGTLLEGDGFAVAHEAAGDHAPRLSPGWRNVTVFDADLAGFAARAGTLGAHLKAIGVAGGDPRALAAALPVGLAPRVCAAGAMQTPPLGAYADGLPPWEGWRRFVSVE